MKSKKLGIGLLLLLAFTVTTGTFAYWAAGVSGNSAALTQTITVGSAEAVTTTVNVTAQTAGELVPATRATVGQVESVVLTFPVTWVEDGSNGTFDGDTATLVNSISNVKIDGATTYTSFANVNITTDPTSITLDGSTVNVVVTVTLTEPTNSTEYTGIAGKDITFDITFTVTP